MLDQMWGMMRLTPFGAAFPGAQPGASQGIVPSLSMMSDMMAPLTNVEELDKRITDMRAVEQWLKLNLNMLQSAIQALEVQRATLATLRAFGAFAQSSMAQPAARTAQPDPVVAASRGDAAAAQPESGEATAPPSFDTSGWWNLLQSQFNQIAQFAMTQPGAAGQGAADEGEARERGTPASGGAGENQVDEQSANERGAGETPAAKLSAKRPVAKRPATAKRAGTTAPRKVPE
jgi:hypothetical protein